MIELQISKDVELRCFKDGTKMDTRKFYDSHKQQWTCECGLIGLQYKNSQTCWVAFDSKADFGIYTNTD